MPITTPTCYVLTCDVCGDDYAPTDHIVHFPTLDEARQEPRLDGWTVTTGLRVICDVRDDAHQAAFDGLLPPEPTMQIPGQLAFGPPAQGE